MIIRVGEQSIDYLLSEDFCYFIQYFPWFWCTDLCKMMPFPYLNSVRVLLLVYSSFTHIATMWITVFYTCRWSGGDLVLLLLHYIWKCVVRISYRRVCWNIISGFSYQNSSLIRYNAGDGLKKIPLYFQIKKFSHHLHVH